MKTTSGIHDRPINILYEDNHLLAVAKPAGIATMGTACGKTSMLNIVKQYLKTKYAKPGNVYLGVVSRLDLPVTGVLLFARTSKAAARLSDQFRGGLVKKTYWTIVSGMPKPRSNSLQDWLIKDESLRCMKAAKQNTKGAKLAELSYATIARIERGTLLKLCPKTGRRHQIRVQLANRGHPVRGDAKYGSRWTFASGIALHARQLVLHHPVRKVPLTLIAPIPQVWRNCGVHEESDRNL